jgi:FdhD protein
VWIDELEGELEDGGRAVRIELVSIAADGARTAVARPIAVERPIAIEFNGLGYAVIMATPADLADFATGFALSERLIARADEVIDVDVHPTADGDLLRVTLAPDRVPAVVERVRHRVTESACGLCGIENLEQAIRPLRRVRPAPPPSDRAVFAAVEGLRAHQPLNRATGAVHAAALVAADGTLRCVREDVGRHTAFDKLIGAMLREGLAWEGGFALLSSRCSYELVEKAALADCPMLVTISAPTSLAVARAREAGVRLVVIARSDAVLAVPEGN